MDGLVCGQEEGARARKGERKQVCAFSVQTDILLMDSLIERISGTYSKILMERVEIFLFRWFFIFVAF